MHETVVCHQNGKDEERSLCRRTFLEVGLGDYAHLFETRRAGTDLGFVYRCPHGLCLFRLPMPREMRFEWWARYFLQL
jgi:hypothetical protein